VSDVRPDLPPRQPRRLLHFVSTFAVKTDTKWLLQIARHLDRDDFDLHVACFYEAGPVQSQLDQLGVKTYNLDAPFEADPRAVVRAKRLMDRLRPDLVHTHLLRADLFGATAARWAGVPVVLSTVYGVGAFRRSKKRRSDYLLDLACAALPTHMLAVSEAVKRDLVDRLNVREEDVTVIHTGIDPPEGCMTPTVAEVRRSWRVADDQPVVLTLARLSYEKGIDTLIDAAAIVHRALPAARFVVVGDGPDRGALEARLAARNLAGVIRLAGFAENVWPLLAACDAVALPSKSEGMPNALLEAMAVGKPIAATRVGGIPEAIQSGENGLLVEPQSPAALAEAVLALLDNPQRATRFGAAARQTVQHRFLARDVVARYADLYHRLLAARDDTHARVAGH
jgi:glycosyltransferase involved in cell wall biosynthesis